jgi:glycosyltransferase involved in cell wall biosynthesis
MRIAFFSWESVHSIYVGGIAAHVSELACALAQKGHEVHLFTRVGESQSTYECIEGVHYHRCSFDFDNDFPTAIENMCRSFIQHFFKAEKSFGSFDIIHTHDWLTAHVLIWLKDVRNCRYIFTMHSTEYGRCGNNSPNTEQSELVSHIEWNGIYHADHVIAVSNILKEELKYLYQSPTDKVSVVYNGVTCQNFDGWIDHLAVRRMYDIKEQDLMVLFVGRMVYQKGPDLLAEAIPGILYNNPNAKFVFVGDGDMRLGVREQVQRLGVEHATRFTGQLVPWKIRDLYKSADCVCVPSRNEPFGIVILESWSAGKPVVASVNGGPSEFVWHEINGYKINPQKESIQWGVNTLLADQGQAQWMGQNGRIATETVFSWDKIADETLAVY